MSTKLTVRNLYKVFGENPDEAIELAERRVGKEEIFERTGSTVAVYDANFSIDEGEVFVVMGLSGSGKSTLVRLLNRLIEPTSGEIIVDGENIVGMSREQLRHVRRRKMSMVFQSFALMPHMNVIDNAAFALELSGIPRSERAARALSALEQVGLKSYAESYPDELSGGMQQRVGLARALANDPDILLMDEAFSALDPLIRSEMQDELVKLQENSNRTVIFISHDLDEAMRIGNRIAIMEGGRIAQIGTPDEILRNPADEYVESFFRGVNVATVLCARDIAEKNPGAVTVHAGLGVGAALEALERSGESHGFVVDENGIFKGVVSRDGLVAARANGHDRLDRDGLEDIDAVDGGVTLKALIGPVAAAPCGIPVVDDARRYLGVVTRESLLQTLDRQPS